VKYRIYVHRSVFVSRIPMTIVTSL
jgi:hypothetical protein